MALSETDAVTATEPVHTTCMLARAVKLNRTLQSRQNNQIQHDEVWKEIKPAGLCYTNNEYCLIAEHRNEMTFFPLSRIKNIRYREKTECCQANIRAIKEHPGKANMK